MCDALELNHIQDEPARQAIRGLLNLIEDLKQENRALREDNQRLRDALNHLKGEQGKPVIKGNTPPRPAPDYSSERERHPPQRRGKRGARAPIPIDREQTLTVDPATLPPMPSSRATKRSSSRISSSAPTTSTSAKRSSTRRPPARPTWRPCRRAITGSLVPGSTPWC